MYLVSACLAGENCRYDGTNSKNDKIVHLVTEGKAITICPEVAGGLSVPREPCEVVKIPNGATKVFSRSRKDVTRNFMKGARKALRIVRKRGIRTAIFKSYSPSCGFGKIYDGTFTGVLTDGNGITVELLRRYGVKIYTEMSIDELEL